MTTSGHSAASWRLVLSGRARHVSFGDETLVADLEDGRQIAVPIAWFPRLAAAGAAQRSNWELVGRGIGIYWPDIDEDISVANLLGADGELLMAADRGVEKHTPETQALRREQMDRLMEAVKAGEQERVREILREMGLKGQALEITRTLLEHPEWDDTETFPEMTITFHLRPNRPPVFEVTDEIIEEPGSGLVIDVTDEVTEEPGSGSDAGSDDAEPPPRSAATA